MKTWNIEIQKVKAMANGNGLIRAQIDALVQPAASNDEGMPSSVLAFTEANARILMMLLKTQLAELDSRKAKSRR
jgi:hypothetical protein